MDIPRPESYDANRHGSECELPGACQGENAVPQSDGSRLELVEKKTSDFLATLGHELRNPLAPLRSGLDLLKLCGVEGPEAEAILEMMDSHLSHVVRLVDDVLELSRISSGTFELRTERIELRLALQAALQSTQHLIEEQAQVLAVELPPEPLYVTADPVRMTQILTNLLQTTSKRTPTRGRIRVALRICEGARAGQIEICIGDERDADADEGDPAPTDTHRGELGAGLMLASKLVELHGGTLASSGGRTGRRSIVTVCLPSADSPSADPQSADARESPAIRVAKKDRPNRPKILVVDDNPDAAHSLARLLGLLGNEVSTAHDGASALAQMERFAPQLVLLDLGLPDIDGVETARRIRARPEWGQTALVALTGWSQESDRRQTEQAGFAAHLVKPVNLQLLEQTLDELL